MRVILTAFQITLSQKFGTFLNMLFVLNMPVFWIYRGYEYASVTQSFWAYLNNSCVCLNMSEYTWMCQNMREYAWIYLNVFCFRFLHCILLSTWTHGCLFQRKTRTNVKKHEAVFLMSQNLFFFYNGWKYWFDFCYRLNISWLSIDFKFASNHTFEVQLTTNDK